MTYFQLYPHCYLVYGSSHNAIFDIFQERVFWLNDPIFEEVVKLLEGGKSLEEICQDICEDFTKIQAFVTLLQSLDYGAYQPRPCYPEKFRPAILTGQEETFTLHRPLSCAVIELTSICSLQCSFCGFCNGWATKLCACGKWDFDRENVFYDYPRLVSELATYGCKQLHIQGGDPFLEKETLHSLINAAIDKKLKVSVLSPGVGLTKNDIRLIGDTGLELVVPIFGADAETHDSTTGISGSFEEVTDLIRRKSINLTVKLMLTNDTIHQRDSIMEYLTGYGLQQIAVDVFVSFDNSVNLNKPEVDAILKLFKRAPRDFSSSIESFFRLSKGNECWQDKIAITRSGDVLPCIASRQHVIGNVNLESLLNILRSKSRFAIRDGGKDSFAPCSGCEFRYGCSTCSLATEKIFGSWRNKSWNCTYNPLSGEWGIPSKSISEHK